MMNKPKIKILLVCIACAALGSYSAKLLFDHIAKQNGFDRKEEIKVMPTAVTMPPAIAPIPVPIPVTETPAKTKASSSKPTLALNGIVFSPGSSYALINNKVVKEGDKIEGTVVVRIAKDNVELKDGQILKLKTGF
jgi:type II secretory pathway component PulC